MARLNLGESDPDGMACYAPADRDNGAAGMVFRVELR